MFSPFPLKYCIMHMIQAKELAQYEEDKTITKLNQSFQTYSKQTEIVCAHSASGTSSI